MSNSKLTGLSTMLSPQLALAEGRLRSAQNLVGNKQTAQDTSAKPQHEQEIVKAATQFESLLLQEMFKEMWSTVPKGGLFSGSSEEDTYQDMYRQALAESVAQNQGLGIKDVIIRDIKATEARVKKADSNGPEGAS